jgi:hypothetical protein
MSVSVKVDEYGEVISLDLEKIAVVKDSEQIDQYAIVQNKLEEALTDFFKKKEMLKELSEDVKMLKEDVEHYLSMLNKSEFAHQLPDGEFATAIIRTKDRDVLDKDSLSLELQIPKEELKTPFDFSFLTFKQKIKPEMISKHTHPVVTKRLTLSKKKQDPLRRKKRKQKEMA